MKILQDYYAYFNDRDWDRFLGLLSPDVVHEISQGQTQVGLEAFRSFMLHMDNCYRETVSQLCLMQNPEGTRAAAEFWLDGIYLQSDEGLPAARGQSYRLRVGAFFEILNGRICRVSNHYNLKDWIRQVSEPSAGPDEPGKQPRDSGPK